MNDPVSTYRVQFNKDFTFRDLQPLIPYIESLGVRTIYASPIFKAVPDSMHGYDIVNPHQINPEIGTEEELRTLINRLHRSGIGWLQDIVPNHMAFHSDNVWLMDVLEKGSMSVYSDFFDITWAGDFYQSRLMAPFLGASLEETINSGAITLQHYRGLLMLHYADHHYPVNARTYELVLEKSGTRPDSLRVFVAQLDSLHQINDRTQYALRMRELQVEFDAMMNIQSLGDIFIATLAKINRSSDMLTTICDQQFYRLCDWRETTSRINYRRFFTINSLICLNMQSKKVFDLYHRFIKSFVEEKLFDGLRIDHIDGLYDPLEYVTRLRSLCGDSTYIIVEKILEPGEALNTQWPVQGTTGYDFLAAVNNLFTFRGSETKLSLFYSSLLKRNKSPEEKRIEKKTAILNEYMRGELDNLYHLFIRSGLSESTIPERDIKEAIGVFLVLCPVYRMYGNRMPLDKKEANRISDVLFECRRRRADLSAVFDLLERDLLEKPNEADGQFNDSALVFYQRCMQFSGPLMAKGVEDTLMYTFNRFLGHNEVGDSLEVFGISANEFHDFMVERSHRWPLTLNATATHDTKRGEDSRMRLNVLSDLASEWVENVKQWMESNNALKDGSYPDSNDEYFIYQTIVASYPFMQDDSYLERLHAYFTKAFREAKRYTGWAEPEEKFESAINTFIDRILDPQSKFLSTFLPLHHKIADAGIVNSLSQLLLKFTCPGIPDCYQGTTTWDFNLVDPDNRRPVDYISSQQQLEWIEAHRSDKNFINFLWESRRDGTIKLWLLSRLQELRGEFHDVFADGLYVPLEVTGKHKEHAIAYARREASRWIVVLVLLNTASIASGDSITIDWSDTSVKLPKEIPDKWKNLLTSSTGKQNGLLSLKESMRELPFLMLLFEKPVKQRQAGILFSITSLPSLHGIGEMGEEARDFANMLSRSGQSFWQLLPLNPVSASANFSPYSSYSSRAGNPLLIAGSSLVTAGLLTANELQEYLMPVRETVNYKEVQAMKDAMLETAWSHFMDGSHQQMQRWVDEFAQRESEWLDDVALFEILLRAHGERWEEWPEEYKRHDRESLEQLRHSHTDEIRKIHFVQFLFFQQWSNLKSYCNAIGVKLIGDLPFYVSYHSADVWSHPEFFDLDENQKIKGVAGVPPDFFSEDGQLWGMPVYRWDTLRKNGYLWWIERIKKNLKLFDVVRLDHFRAFANYWVVSGNATTARNGEWKDGPGEEFFEIVYQQLGALPFIAEDLGEIHPDVFKLREKFGLAGMKILQYAFGEDSAESPYAPHHFEKNFVVYTGTHDNNTTRGWYRKDISAQERQRVNDYFGYRINEKNVSKSMIRLAYSSVANTVIIPMQDVLNLTERSRTNLPSTVKKNWEWKLKSLSGEEFESSLLALTRLYHR